MKEWVILCLLLLLMISIISIVSLMGSVMFYIISVVGILLELRNKLDVIYKIFLV